MHSEDRHAAFIAGYDTGLTERFRADVSDAVHTALHQQALEALGMARRLARAKGPAWEALIVWSGESE